MNREAWVSSQDLMKTRVCDGNGCANDADGDDGYCAPCRKLRISPVRNRRYVELPPAELEALRYAAEGYSREDTARLLGKSADTIKTQHRKAIAKLGAHNITHAVTIAFRQGLLT